MGQSWIEDSDYKKIAKRLIELRKSAGYSSYENFAVEFGFGRKYYWMVESGKAKISLDYLIRILRCHSVKPSDFFKSIDL